VDFALVHQHAHGVDSVLERVGAHDSLKHLGKWYEPPA
jgi:hypothetical protein